MGCLKCWVMTGRCYCFLSAPQRGCFAPVHPVAPRTLVLQLHAPESVDPASLTVVFEALRFSSPSDRPGMDTVQKNSRTRYSSAGNFQFSNLGEMVRHATHAKLLLLEPHLPNPGCFKGGGKEWDFPSSDSNQMKCFCSFLARSAPLTFQNNIMCCSCRRECGDGAIWLSGCGHEKMPRVRNGYMQTRHSEQKLHSEAQRQIQGAMGGHDRR